MSIRDTKEGRDLVGLGLKVLALADDATAYAAHIERDPHTSERLKAVVRDLVDPANLAKLMASEARRLGLHSIRVDDIGGEINLAIGYNEDGDGRELTFDLPQSSRILAQWLKLPPGASDAAERALRGDHG